MEVEISYLGVEMTIEGMYYPGEPEIMYESDMGGYPGSSSEFEIFNVFVGEVSIIDLLSSYQMQEIQSEVLEKIEE
jgi:hypothetical protein